MVTIESEALAQVCRMIRIAGDEKESEAVRQWAREQGKAALMRWSILRAPMGK